ncbi:MAG: DUF2938 domain-containing protein [Lysobacterales bacterium]
MHSILATLLAGLGATALSDLWGLLRHPLFGVAAPNYALVGRWFAHMRHGRYTHAAIAQATPMPHERLIGWSAHYAIGVAYAAVLVLLCGPDWLAQPRLAPALLLGLATLAFPMLWMQPAMGAGIAASRTPHPWQARLHSVLLHSAFGLGLYLTACLLQALS